MHLWVLPARASVTPSNKRRFHIYWRQLALCAFPSHVWLAVVKVTQLSIKPDTLFYGCSLSNQCTATESHHHTVSVGPVSLCVSVGWTGSLKQACPRRRRQKRPQRKVQKNVIEMLFFSFVTADLLFLTHISVLLQVKMTWKKSIGTVFWI